MALTIELMERKLLPDAAIRIGIRRLLAQRLSELSAPGATVREKSFIESLREQPVAVETDKANEQHYEVPSVFFHEVLGPRLKYSSCYWPDGVTSLEQAEEQMLALTCERAGIADGMRILELGCGWGSLSLWMAATYPDSHITAVSNSHSQRAFIEQRAAKEGCRNVTVITADVNQFETERNAYDRVISVEMFEHMRNYTTLLERIAQWLKADGQLFIHIFCNRDHVYPFESEGDDNWMGRYFFTGGLMPSEALMKTFNNHLTVTEQWRVNGLHYAKTLRAWLDTMDRKRDRVLPILKEAYGEQEGARWFQRWRIFFMACEELFAYNEGHTWFVTHLLLRPQATADAPPSA